MKADFLMDPIEAARALLPPWVQWANAILFPGLACFISLVSMALGLLIALAPRRSTDSWVERARQLYPARRLIFGSVLVFPIAFAVLASFFAGPMSRVPAALLSVLAGLAAYATIVALNIRLENRWRAEPLPLRKWLQSSLLVWLVLLPSIAVFVGTLVILPDNLGIEAAAVLVIAAIMLVCASRGDGLLVASILGLAKPPSARLADLVGKTAEAMGIRVRAIYELPSSRANAFAFPLGRRLAFTEPLLQTATDEELRSIAAHELAHLSEPRSIALVRTLPLLAVLPMIAAWQMRDSFGLIGGVAAFFTVLLLVSLLVRRITRRLEVRADAVARTQEEHPGVYARALEKIYEANLVPVVLSRHATHPDLYDRLVAAGVVPSYKRPAPPSRFRMVLSVVVASTVAVALTGVAGFGSAILFSDRGSESALLVSIAIDGGKARTLSDLALLRFHQDDRDAAVAFYRAASALDAGSAYYPANLAIVLARMDRYEEAAASLEEAQLRLERSGNRDSATTDLVMVARQAVARCQARQAILKP
jgi:Zn-dependent protease with chaperone function